MWCTSLRNLLCNLKLRRTEAKVKVKDLKPKRIKDYLEYKFSQRTLPSRVTVFKQAEQSDPSRDNLPRSDPLSLVETSPLSSSRSRILKPLYERSGTEDIDHVLRFCMMAYELWRYVLGQEVENGFDELSFDEWLHGNITGILIGDVEREEWGMRFSVYCWLLWKRRCNMVFDADFIERETVLDRGNRFIEDCKAAYSPLRMNPMVVQQRGQSWEGALRGWVKGNVDVVVNTSDGRAAVAWVFRDDAGAWLLGFARSIGRSSVIVPELWAIRDGLQYAWDGSFRQVELETDNAEAESICNGLSPALQHNVLVSEIHDWLQRSWQVRIRHVGRSGNAMADKLARLGQHYLMQGSYFALPPVEVIALVGEEQRRWEDRLMGS
ncbi:hypothetical protein GQ457_15G016670 [Hibiscus cannabinus]